MNNSFRQLGYKALLFGSIFFFYSVSASAITPQVKASATADALQSAGTNDILNVGEFGEIALYRPTGEVKQVVIFISGDGGWNQGVVSMAENMRNQGALVAGIDIRSYFKNLNVSKEKCAYLGADFERLSRLIQQHENLSQYHYPILVGYSSGATLAYAILNQTPQGVFSGGLSLGFCPDLELDKPLCRGDQLKATKRNKGVGVDLLGVTKMHDPWFALQGEQDQVCDAQATKQFVSGIGNAQLIMLPKVGHGYSVEKNWLPQFMAAYSSLSKAPQSAPPPSPHDLADLPIIEVPATTKQDTTFALLITGDGGYAGMDQEIAAGLSAQGQPVVVLNSLKYFWTSRTQQQVANDVDRIVRYYTAKWHKQKVVLIGYSQGADMIPFVLNRLPDASKATIATAAAIGISDNAVFEFHIANWLKDPKGTPTLPELKKLNAKSFVCIYGEEETDSVCPKLSPATARLVKLPGGHHFNGDYSAVARAVLKDTK